MRAEGISIELPDLVSNPFSTSPIEGNQNSLYVGRLDTRARISQHINFRSNRKILLVGEYGSGRTSLLRCAALDAPISVHIDHISSNNPGLSLLQKMYSELVGFQLPDNQVELVSKLVESSRSFSNKLPLIVIDMPTVEDGVLSVALRDVMPSLERLNAVIVVVIEPKQKTSIPDSVMHSFADVETLSPLSADEIKELVERRIDTVSQDEFKLSTTLAREIFQRTAGSPYEVVKLMRDVVDSQIMSSGERIVAYQPEYNMPELPTDVEDIESNQEDSHIIDASIPWQERNESEVQGFEVESMFGFELDLDELKESKLQDEPIQEYSFSATPESYEVVNQQIDTRPMPEEIGVFGGLLGRTRNISQDDDEKPNDNMVNHEQLDGTELWISEELLQPEERIEFTEENSAEIIHDEIGFEFEQDSDNEHIDNFTEEVSILENNNTDNSTLNQILTLLSSMIQPNNNLNIQSSIFQGLMTLSNSKQSEKQDYPLNPIALSSLNNNESYVVSIANTRKFSPSDKEILEHLKIKRSRLSQISNKLLKSGILSVRMHGRSRYFELTQTARAQLMAWGIIGGAE